MCVFLNNVGMEVYFILTLLGLLSLAVGSFISAISYRIPRGLGFIKGRSFCDSCKKELKWYDNIPLISFLFYGAAARCCGKRISIRYPLIELATLIGFVALFLLSVNSAYYILYVISLLVLVIDLEHQIIPDELTWIILVLGLMAGVQSPITALFIAFFLSLLLLSLFIITAGRGMGLGDVKLAVGLGVWLSFVDGLKWLMVSFILGGIVASVLLLLKRANLKTKIAFGPFLIVGFWIILLITKLY
ncbi:MAG: prepilin peptidase [Microgenomates group bacterium]